MTGRMMNVAVLCHCGYGFTADWADGALVMCPKCGDVFRPVRSAVLERFVEDFCATMGTYTPRALRDDVREAIERTQPWMAKPSRRLEEPDSAFRQRLLEQAPITVQPFVTEVSLPMDAVLAPAGSQLVVKPDGMTEEAFECYFTGEIEEPR